MALPDATSAYLARAGMTPQPGGGAGMARPTTPQRGFPTMSAAAGPTAIPATSSVKRDGAYRKATLDILYTLYRTGQLPEGALQSLMGG